MTTDSTSCFDALAADARWREFTAEERLKIEAFRRRWRIKPGDRVLEPGCGSGRLTVLLAELTGPKGRVVAFDASPEFARLASMRKLPSHVTLLTARAQTLPLEPGSFDHVVCLNVYPHLVPQVAIARRFAAALRPGGRLWIAHTCSRSFVNAVHRGGSPALHGHLLPAPAELRRLLREAGFGKIEIEDGADCFFAEAVRPPPRAAPHRAKPRP